jgi:two-component system LytT family response regulator
MITAVIIDDEQNVVDNLSILLKDYCPDIRVIGTANSYREAKVVIDAKNPDLLFLDIEMPNGNGFDLLKSFSSINFQVIFVTAYSQYALNAIKASAVDYLLKPIDIDELKAAVKKVNVKEKINDNGAINKLIESLRSGNLSHNKVAIPTMQGLEFISVSDILYCRADGHYTVIELTGNQKIVSSKGIGEYELLLPTSLFCRIHNSYLINLKHIQKYMKGKGGSVIMDNGKTIEVSTRKKDAFLEQFESRNA